MLVLRCWLAALCLFVADADFNIGTGHKLCEASSTGPESICSHRKGYIMLGPYTTKPYRIKNPSTFKFDIAIIVKARQTPITFAMRQGKGKPKIYETAQKDRLIHFRKVDKVYIVAGQKDFRDSPVPIEIYYIIDCHLQVKAYPSIWTGAQDADDYKRDKRWFIIPHDKDDDVEMFTYIFTRELELPPGKTLKIWNALTGTLLHFFHRPKNGKPGLWRSVEVEEVQMQEGAESSVEVITAGNPDRILNPTIVLCVEHDADPAEVHFRIQFKGLSFKDLECIDQVEVGTDDFSWPAPCKHVDGGPDDGRTFQVVVDMMAIIINDPEADKNRRRLQTIPISRCADALDVKEIRKCSGMGDCSGVCLMYIMRRHIRFRLSSYHSRP